MVGWGVDAEFSEAIVRDYECLAGLGAKRRSDLRREGSESGHAPFERLLAAGLAAEQDGAIVLRHPGDCPVPLDRSLTERMSAHYRGWLRVDGGSPAGQSTAEDADELLYGELGFWQHWWNRIRERDFAAQGPLQMDIVIPDDGSFEARSWLAEFDPEIRSHVLGQGLIRGRAIVPPPALGSPVEPMLDLSAESGFSVRVLSAEARFVLYDERIAVLSGAPDSAPPQPHPHALESYRAVRRPEVVEPLQHFFALLWRSATPFRAYRGDHDAVLEMLARGFTDARIALALNVSARTVSRRVSEIMAEYGAGSRFELGMMYGRHHRDPRAGDEDRGEITPALTRSARTLPPYRHERDASGTGRR